MSKGKVLQIMNIIGFIAVLVVNTLANTLPINGKTTGEVSALYPNLFVPAGYTFGIWGLIYLLLGLFIVYQSRHLFSSRKQVPRVVQLIGPWFLWSCVANCSWILAWHHFKEFFSVQIMLFLLICLIIIYYRLNNKGAAKSNIEKFSVEVPFSIYLGWISVATIANVAAFLVDEDWRGRPMTEEFWTIIMIAGATLLGVIMLLKKNEVPYALVLCWAFSGIFVNNSDRPGSQYLLVSLGIGFALLLVLSIARFNRWVKTSTE